METYEYETSEFKTPSPSSMTAILSFNFRLSVDDSLRVNYLLRLAKKIVFNRMKIA